jgi:hypothetical protein
MAYILHADAAGEIEKAIAVHIFQDCAFSPRRKDRRGVTDAARHSGLTAAHQFLRFRARYRSSQLDRGHVSTIR